MNIEKIIRTLKSLMLNGWAVLFQEEEKSALYLTKAGEIETSIDSRRISAEITIYRKYGAHVGDARFSIFSDDEDELREKVRDALIICATAKKPTWPLPRRQVYHTTALLDKNIIVAFKKGTVEEVNLALWMNMLRAAKRERGIVISAAELHLRKTRSVVRNSVGLVAGSERTELFVETIFTSFVGAGKERREQEFHASQTVERLADFNPAQFVKHHAQLARDVLAAEQFGKVQETGIVLTGEALREFWAPNLDLNPVVFHAGGQVKHRGLSRYELGKRITLNKGFSIVSDPLVPFNPGSNRFDLDGVASQRVKIIEQGVVRNYFSSQRYAHYLKVRPTGGLGVIELSPGNEPSSRLKEGKIVEIVSFSSFSPNSVSGDFSAEIRLGYLHEGGKRIPVRAAMLSGNVFAMLDTMRLSKELVVAEKYSGPVAVRFEGGCRLAGF